MNNEIVSKEQETRDFVELQKEKISRFIKGNMLPKGCTPDEAFARIIAGADLGLKPFQAINGIAILNGKPTLHSDSIPAIVMATGMVEDMGHKFEGQDEDYPEITFFAPPSFSILRYVWDEASGKDTGNQRPLTEEEKNHPERLVQALDPDWCREMVMRHVVKGKFLKADIAYRDPSYDIAAEEQTGGTDFTCESGNKVRAYRDKSAYGGVPDAGPETLYLYSFDAMQMVPLASPDIQPLNGVVHALNYNYVLGRI